jgi:hypothetical protein
VSTLRLAVAAAALCAGLVLASPAGAAYDRSVRCAGKTVRDVELVTRSSDGAAFRKLKRTASGSQAVTYACLVRSGRIRRLDDPARSLNAQGPRLAGRFVGFERVDNSDQSSPPSDLVVQDLRTGRRRVLTAAPDPPELTSVAAFVLKRNGSVAWIVVGHSSARQELWTDTAVGGPQRIDASPPAIDVGSLRLSASRRSVLWRKAGDTSDRSAPLR